MKKQSKKAFLDKIKTLSINTGKAKPERPTCADCGKPMQFVGAGIVFRTRLQPVRSDEEAFAA